MQLKAFQVYTNKYSYSYNKNTFDHCIKQNKFTPYSCYGNIKVSTFVKGGANFSCHTHASNCTSTCIT